MDTQTRLYGDDRLEQDKLASQPLNGGAEVAFGSESSSSVPARGRGSGNRPLSVSETDVFRARLLKLVQADPEYDALSPTEQRYLTVLVKEFSNEGGEMFVKHDQLAIYMPTGRRGRRSRTGVHCRHTALRVLRALVEKGLLTSGTRYRWVIKTSTKGKPYWMKMRLANVYRIANRFMSALKAAKKLISRRHVTAEKPSRSGMESSTTETELVRAQRYRGLRKKARPKLSLRKVVRAWWANTRWAKRRLHRSVPW